uniref:Uncharacterized protein n=1 Tax=Moniliophthora roreri TaxID=221103 RepID=A0A0W0EU92_MONRR
MAPQFLHGRKDVTLVGATLTESSQTARLPVSQLVPLLRPKPQPPPKPHYPPPPPHDGYKQVFSEHDGAIQADDYLTFGLVDSVAGQYLVSYWFLLD